MPHLIRFFYKHYVRQFVIAAHGCFFVLVLKSERCIDISKTGHQDREFESEIESSRKKEFLFTKLKWQIILMKKNGLNVEHFR